MEFWGFIRHNGVLASTDHVAGKPFGAFVVIDEDFIEREGFDFGIRFCVEGLFAIGDRMFVDDSDGKV